MSRVLVLSMLALTVCLPGCGETLESLIVPPSTTTLRLINRTDFTVEATLYTSPVTNVSGSELSLIGTQRDFVLGTAQVEVVSLPCEEIMSFIVGSATLEAPGDPHDATGNVRSGTYTCGDTITIIFDHTSNFQNFTVQVQVEPN